MATKRQIELGPRWYELRHVAPQARLWDDIARFQIACAGRRSGKSELAKRKVALRAAREFRYLDGWFVCAAPTHKQAKRIMWSDMKALTKPFWRRRPSESELTIYLENGMNIGVLGLDAPDRIEGAPLNGIWIDEFGNIKKEVWSENIRPMLSERDGWAIITGVPEGRNHYYDLAMAARTGELGDDWSYHHWISAEVLPPEEIEAARRELDERSFHQEFEASFVDVRGRAYYTFDFDVHCRELGYVPTEPLHFCFDFNVSPGSVEVTQELTQPVPPSDADSPEEAVATCSVDEISIRDECYTPTVCRAIIERYGKHEGLVYIYGDATGGQRNTSQTSGHNWRIIRDLLGEQFGPRLQFRVPPSNPYQLDRINACNSRIKSYRGDVRYFVDPKRCPELVKDWESVQVLPGTAGEIDKRTDKLRTHYSDAVGYHLHREYPPYGPRVSSAEALF